MSEAPTRTLAYDDSRGKTGGGAPPPAAPKGTETLAYDGRVVTGTEVARGSASLGASGDDSIGGNKTIAAGSTLRLDESMGGDATMAANATLDAGTTSGGTPQRASRLSLVARTKGPPTLVARATTVLPRADDDEDALTLPADAAHPRYVAHDVLGEGGMGEVVLARDHDIRRQVAIKRLPADAAGPVALLRFVEEIRTVGALEHPGIVPVYDVGIDHAGAHYFVMKYLEGETLEAVLDKLRAGDGTYVARYTPEYRAHLFLQILRAVDYAHARGIIHRDLKPANIMIGPFGEVTVTDWGIAKRIRPEGAPRPAAVGPAGPVPSRPKKRAWITWSAMKRLRRERSKCAKGELFKGTLPHDDTVAAEASSRPSMMGKTGRAIETRVGALMGTPMFMAPEQARGENDRLDERTDVYALGVLFYELMTLHHYLDDKKNVAEILDAVLHEPMAPRIWEGWHKAKAPAGMLHFTNAAIAHEPDERFPNAGAMADELEQILAGNVCIQCPYTLAERSSREFNNFTLKHPKLTGLGVFTTLFAVFVALPAAVAMMAMRAMH